MNTPVTSRLAPKRLPPQIEQVVNGIKIEGNRVRSIEDKSGNLYSVYNQNLNNEENEFYVKAQSKTGEILWNSIYFKNTLIPGLESDVQDIFVVDFLLDNENLIIKHEYYDKNSGAGIFKIDPVTGASVL